MVQRKPTGLKGQYDVNVKKVKRSYGSGVFGAIAPKRTTKGAAMMPKKK